MKKIRNLTLLLSSLSLAACNSTEPEMVTQMAATPPMTAPTPPEAEPESIARLFENANAVSYATSGFTIENDRGGDAMLTGSKNVTVEAINDETTGETQVMLTAFGQTVTFSEADLTTPTRFSKELPTTGAIATRVTLDSLDGDWSDVQDGNTDFKYLVRFRADVSDANNNSFNQFYGALGDVTPDMPTGSNATYTGSATGTLLSDKTVPGQEMTADFSLNVDLRNANIGGSVTNITFDGTAEPTEFEIKNVPITNSTFKSTLEIDPTSCGNDCVTLSKSNVDGSFFGDDAQEVGGSLEFEGSDSDGGEFIAIGAFGATKQ